MFDVMISNYGVVVVEFFSFSLTFILSLIGTVGRLERNERRENSKKADERLMKCYFI